MKKALCIAIVVILAMTILTVTAFAASFKGDIWTGKPGILGIGYYCTAARNDSGQASIDRAEAKCYNSLLKVTSSGASSGNTRAVANNGSTKPYKGWGRYWQVGTTNTSSATFYAGSWD